MKINEVERLVGVTKRNIRFYEKEGLLAPDRNAENGYRDYGEADVETLKKIKLLRKLDLPPVPILLGLVLGRMTETNFRRALLISNGDASIFLQSIYCKIFLALIIIAVAAIVRGKLKEQKAAKIAAAAQKEND